MNRGKLITFEGIDGCGKTTQLRLLERVLTSRNIPFVSTREPGGTDLGKTIRATLLNVSRQKVEPLAELLLYSADRSQHVREVVMPNLEAGMLVLSDRFMTPLLPTKVLVADLIYHSSNSSMIWQPAD